MQKIKLEPKYDYTISAGSLDWGDAMRDHVNYAMLTDEQARWLFENTTGRFFIDSYFIFFEKDEDAFAFKLKWL